ncbi:TraK domain-containing protein [Sulfurimonas indica]|uniref:TraK domain-containing protein n=1 Tax=Sulfurimonas TaxID=202746 RepID=UPI00165EE747|nr:type-F conjugative transfer system secretin TraK [Sulfurimonas indica]
MALIVSSFVVVGILSAKDIPMVQTIEIKIPLKEFSVLEFPFEVKEKRFSPFVYKKKIKKKTKKFNPLKEKVSIPNANQGTNNKKFFSLNQFKKKNGTETNKPKNKAFASTWGKNFVQFYPYKIGKTQLIVWGYSKYPLLITIVVSADKKDTDTYLKFVDYQERENKNTSLKGISHEKICSKLIQYLYHNKTPSGYKIETHHQVYNSNSLKFVLIKTLIGKRYSALEYSVENISESTQRLNEPMFASKNTYAISIENRELESGEATRMFVITPTATE